MQQPAITSAVMIIATTRTGQSLRRCRGTGGAMYGKIGSWGIEGGISPYAGW